MYTTTASRITSAQSFFTLFANSVHTVLLAGFISLALISSVSATDFSGTLKKVSITDVQATNKPPTANFTHTVNNATVTFNAGSSSDSDGTISEYKWNFGDGNTGSGIQTEHTYITKTTTAVTLTITDNNNGISLVQIPIIFHDNISVHDDFNRTNQYVGSNWTAISGMSLSYIGSSNVIQGIKSTGEYGEVWSANQFNADQMATITIKNSGSGGVIVRGQPSADTYYAFVLYGSYSKLVKVVAGVETQLGTNYGNIVSGQTIGLKIIGSILTPYINGVAQTTRVDTDITSGQPGIYHYGVYFQGDNWQAQEVSE